MQNQKRLCFTWRCRMIDWEFYSKRRKINLVNLILRNNIESYEQLKTFLAEKDVTAPEQGAFQAAYAIAVPPINLKPEPKPKPSTKAKTTRRPRTRKKAATKKGK